MDPRLDVALRPGEPGRLVRAAGRFLAGVAVTERQIDGHSAYWRAEALASIRAGGPVLVALGDSLFGTIEG